MVEQEDKVCFYFKTGHVYIVCMETKLSATHYVYRVNAICLALFFHVYIEERADVY